MRKASNLAPIEKGVALCYLEAKSMAEAISDELSNSDSIEAAFYFSTRLDIINELMEIYEDMLGLANHGEIDFSDL